MSGQTADAIVADMTEPSVQDPAKPRHVAWFVSAPVQVQRDKTLTSPQASARYRCLLPAKELAARGWQCTVHGVGRVDPISFAANLKRTQVDVVVTGKPLGPKMVTLARSVRDLGIPLIADFCDDFFEHPQYGPLSLALAKLGDGLVSSTSVLSQTLERLTGRRSMVISDPYEGPHGDARFSPGTEKLELLWFGHDVNYPTLAPLMPNLEALSRRHPLRLTVVTALDRIEPLRAPSLPGFAIDHVNWSLPAMWQHLADCDVVILPSLKTHHYDAKSPNRLIEALRAGRAAVANSIPSYREFAAYCWLADDFAVAIAAMIADPRSVERRIASGQGFIARHNAPSAIAAQWISCLESTMASARESPAPPAS